MGKENEGEEKGRKDEERVKHGIFFYSILFNNWMGKGSKGKED